MTDIEDDPFAPKSAVAVADNPVSADAVAPAVKAEVVPTHDGKWVATFKGGRDFDAPWLVGHMSSLEEVNDHLSGDKAKLLADTMEKMHRAAKKFVELGGGVSTPASAPAQSRSNAPAAAQAAPGGETRQCRHGEMKFISKSTNGRAWSGFFCPQPKESTEKCEPEFLKSRN